MPRSPLPSILPAMACAALLIAAAPAAADGLHLNLSTSDPVTGLDAGAWESMVAKILRPEGAVGDDAIMVISSLPYPITLTCDRWQIVGPNPYSSVAGNPAEIKPFSVTYVKTKGFDGYCTEGVIGHAGIKTFRGKVDDPSGSFTKSTTILFSGAPAQ